jgi:hypothetical protein
MIGQVCVDVSSVLMERFAHIEAGHPQRPFDRSQTSGLALARLRVRRGVRFLRRVPEVIGIGWQADHGPMAQGAAGIRAAAIPRSSSRNGCSLANICRTPD